MATNEELNKVLMKYGSQQRQMNNIPARLFYNTKKNPNPSYSEAVMAEESLLVAMAERRTVKFGAALYQAMQIIGDIESNTKAK